MGHGIEERDGVFAVRQAMWHGLGVVLPEYPTREEAQRIAHPWEPKTEPVYRRLVTVDHHWHDESCPNPCPLQGGGATYEEVEFVESTTGVLNARSDTNEELAVVSTTFETVSNGEMYDIAEVIEGQEKGAVQYETGGSLFGGKKVWLMIRLREPINVGGDPNGRVVPYFALQNSHDGTGAFRGQALYDRIVCNNTALGADLMSEQAGTSFKFSHTKNVAERIEEAKTALAGWRSSVVAFQELAEEMVKEPVTVHQRELFLEHFIEMPPPAVVSDRVRQNVLTARDTVRGFLDGPTCEGISYTTYGLLQASVEYLNHARKAQTDQTRFKRAYLDRSKLTSDVVRIAREVVHA